MIELLNLEKYYNKNTKKEIHVLNNINLKLPEKGLITITGPSGCGKTTLLNVMGMIDDFKSGKYKFNDLIFKGYKMNKFDKIRNEKIGFIFQNYNLNPDITVYENLELRLNLAGYFNKEENDALIEKALLSVGLIDCKKRLASYLSGGQKQRVGIARAIIFNPDIILADEPTGNLDSKNTDEIIKLLKELSNDKLVVLVTHEKEIATIYSDRIILMEDGKIISDSDNKNDYEIESTNDKFKFNPQNKSIKKRQTIKNHVAFFNALKRVFLNRRFFGKLFIFIMFIQAFISAFIVARFGAILGGDINPNKYKKNQIGLLSKYDLEFPDKSVSDKIKKLKDFKNFIAYGDIFSMSDYRIFNYVSPGINGSRFYDVGLLPNVYNDENIYLGRKPESDNEVVLSSAAASKILKNHRGNHINIYENEKDLLNLNLYRHLKDNSFPDPKNPSIMNLKIVGITKGNYPYMYFKNNYLYDEVKQNIISTSIDTQLKAYKNLDNPDNNEVLTTNYSDIFSNKYLYKHGDFYFKFYDFDGNLVSEDEVRNLKDDEAYIDKEIFDKDKKNLAKYTTNLTMPYSLKNIIDGNLNLKGTFEIYNKKTNELIFDKDKSNIFVMSDNFKNKLNDYIKLFKADTVKDYGYKHINNNILNTSRLINFPKANGYIIEVNNVESAKNEIKELGLLDDYYIVNPNNYFYSVYKEIKIITAISSLSLFIIFSLFISFSLFFMIRGSTISRGKEIMTMRLIGLRKKEISKVYFFEILVYYLFSFLPGFSIGSILIFNGRNASGFTNIFNMTPIAYFLALSLVLVLFLIIGIIPLLLFLRKTPAKLQSKYEL